MKANKTVELFQTMAIMSLNMENLDLDMSNLKNRVTIEAKEKTTLQEELEKENDFQKKYKHNVEIWSKGQRTNTRSKC